MTPVFPHPTGSCKITGSLVFLQNIHAPLGALPVEAHGAAHWLLYLRLQSETDARVLPSPLGLSYTQAGTALAAQAYNNDSH